MPRRRGPVPTVQHVTRTRQPLPPRVLTGVVVATGLVLTLAVLVLPFARFAYRAPVLHVVLETAEGCIALLVAYLLYGRYRRTGAARMLLLTCALVVVATANLALQALPSALGGGELTPWASLGVRLLGVAVLAAAAFTPQGAGVPRERARVVLVASTLLVLGLVAAAAGYGDRLPPAVDPGWTADALRPSWGGHPLAMLAHAASGLLYAAAAVSFTRGAERDADELLRWLGAGCGLAAVARIVYLLFPSLYSEYVYVGDVLRLGFYLLMLVGAMREVQSYWESQSHAAVLEDRRRLARDLHDGLAQELTYIWSQSTLLARVPGDGQVAERINGAAARAIDEARGAIDALTRTTTAPFAVRLREAVDGLAGRYGVEAQVVADEGVELGPERSEAALRIVAEAFRNGVRHGGATRIEVTAAVSPLRIAVRDDGTGFDRASPATSRGSGFGLTSMRERAEGVGARLVLESVPGAGTTVEVRWP
jgi:signal transduction histidine kinase